MNIFLQIKGNYDFWMKRYIKRYGIKGIKKSPFD